MGRRIHMLEVTVDDSTDQTEQWLAMGEALTLAGFDDVLYGDIIMLDELDDDDSGEPIPFTCRRDCTFGCRGWSDSRKNHPRKGK